MSPLPNRRIMLIDDMPSIHEDFRKILTGAAAPSAFDDVETALFGQSPAAASSAFDIYEKSLPQGDQ